MHRRPPRSTRHDTLCPDTKLCRSDGHVVELREIGLAAVELVGREWRAHIDPLVEVLRQDQIARFRILGWITRLRRRGLGAVIGFGLGECGCYGNRAGNRSGDQQRSEEHTSELQSLMRISYAVFCLKKKIILDQVL